MQKLFHWGAIISLIALILLCLLWETRLAPLHPGGSVLVLKAALLLLPLFGILRARRYTYQWSSMFILLYLCEGVMRAWSEHGLAQRLAAGEILLSTLFFISVVGYARCTEGPRAAKRRK